MKRSLLPILRSWRLIFTMIFTAGFSSPAAISINISQPAAGAVKSELLLVQATVSSVFELSSVTAALDGHQTNLVFSPTAGTWTNTMSLSGLMRGSNTLTVTAQDVFGNTAQTQRVFAVDNPPILLVSAPLNGTVTRGSVYVEAAASDDDAAGTVINVYATYNPSRPAPLLRGTNSVRGYITPSSLPVVFEAVDSAGQKRYVPRQVIVESSTNLFETAAAPGTLLDVTPDRFLYRFTPDLPVQSWDVVLPPRYGKPEARILYRASQQSVVVSGSLNTNGPDYGFLASTGALLGYVSLFAPYYNGLFAWPETNGAYYGPFSSAASNEVEVVAETAAWLLVFPPFGSNQLILQDIFRTNEQSIIGQNVSGFDLNQNFDVVYSVSNQVFRSHPAAPSQPYTNRTTTQLTFAEPATFPVTDGTNVVFRRAVSNGVAIVMLTPGGEETLGLWPSPPGVAYRVNNGWVAFTQPGTTGQSQIWTRSPSGVIEKRTFFGSSSTLESLGPKGEVTLLLDGRYISFPGSAPWWISSIQGTVRWRGGNLLLLLGRSIFEGRVGQLSALASGDLKLTFAGPSGLHGSLETSSNLHQWFNVLDFTNASGTTSWTNPPGSLRQFYRTIVAPH